MIYLDASVLVPLVVPELRSVALSERFSIPSVLTTSDYAVGEASSAVSRLVRTRVVDVDAGRSVLAKLDEWVTLRAAVIECCTADIRLATIFVRQFEPPLNMPDALHLALCRRVGATIISLDAGLVRAAESLDIAVEPIA